MKKAMPHPTIMLISLILFWGVSWPIYKAAVPYTPPLLFSGMRAFIGGILLTVLIWKSRYHVQWKKHWKKYVVSAFFNCVLFFGLHTIGLNYLPGGMFSVLVYVQPILLGVFAWMMLGERLSRFRMLGLLIGFIGILITSWDGVSNHFSWLGVALALATGIAWAYGVIYVKKVSKEINAFWMVAIQSVIGGSFLLVSGTVFESWSDIVWNTPYVIGLTFGITIGIPAAYIIYYSLINQGEASKVGAATFLVPIIAVLISVVFRDETLTIKLFIGMILVGVSIYLVNRNEGRKAVRQNSR